MQIKINSKKIILACYILFLICSVALSLFNFTFDAYLKMTGKLETVNLNIEDFTYLDQLEVTGESSLLTMEGADPKMIYDLGSEPIIVRSIATDMTFSREPGEFNTFYITKKAFNLGHDYSTDDRVWGMQDKDGQWNFTLPRGEVYALRIDPGTFASNEINFSYITLNPAKSFIEYFDFGYDWLFKFIMYPALFSAVLCYVLEFLKKS